MLRPEHVRRLIDLAKSRFGIEVDHDDDIPEGDVYFLFNGGLVSNHDELLKPFQGQKSCTYILCRNTASSERFQRVKDVIWGDGPLDGFLLVVS